jgi:hypothetical protein
MLLVLLLPVTVGGQQAGAMDPLAPLAFLLGGWEGTSEGQPGKATVQREYRRALNSRFIRSRNRSEYPPQEKNPKGEIHIPAGWRARETDIVHGPDEFEEVFALAAPGKEFELYSRARLKRVR